MLNFQWRKAMRDSADHLGTMPSDNIHLDTCPIGVVEQYVAIRGGIRWVGHEEGLPFFSACTSTDRNSGKPARGSLPLCSESRAQRRAQEQQDHEERFPCTPSDQGSGSFEGFSRRRSVYHHATRVLEVSKNCLEIHAGSPSGITRFIGLFHGSRSDSSTIPGGDRWVSVE